MHSLFVKQIALNKYPLMMDLNTLNYNHFANFIYKYIKKDSRINYVDLRRVKSLFTEIRILYDPTEFAKTEIIDIHIDEDDESDDGSDSGHGSEDFELRHLEEVERQMLAEAIKIDLLKFFNTMNMEEKVKYAKRLVLTLPFTKKQLKQYKTLI